MAIVEDKYMSWDTEAHFYLPTAILIQEKLNLNLETELGSKKESDLFLEDMMWFVKDYLIAAGNITDISYLTKQIEYLVADDNSNERLSIKRSFVEFMRYAKNDEGDMVSLQTGLTLNKGQIVPINELRGRRELSGRLERVLRNSQLLFEGEREWEIPTDAVYGTDY